MLRMSWLLLLCASLFSSVKAGNGSLEKQLRSNYRGSVLTLRQFYDADELHFGPDGRRIGDAKTGSWTVDGQLRVTDIHLQDRRLHIKGKRLLLFFDSASKKLQDVTEIRATDSVSKTQNQFGKGKDEKLARKGNALKVVLEVSSVPQRMTDIESVMNLIFLSPNDDLADFVPVFWKNFVLHYEGRPPRVALSGNEPVYDVRENVSKPRAIYQPDPEYSEEARQAGNVGDAEFSLVVTPQGNVQDVNIVTPAGFGLDEEGVKVLNLWRF